MDHNNYPPLSAKQKIAFFAMVVGMFMAVLDIQIVASSLSVIAAGLSASSDEMSWVQTAYLITEVIVIPITGFMTRLLSTRVAYFIATFGFTIMSFACSLAWNIETMIIFRAFQGFFGGAMIPTVFSAIFLIFPPKQRPQATIIVGLVVTIAPTLGPTLGGYITELLSWHFMFLLNIIPGIFVCIAVLLYADFDRPNYDLVRGFDYVGISTMAASLGILQYILEEGNKKNWLEDSYILFLTILTIIGFITLIVWERLYKNPILDFSAFRNKNFTLGCVYSFLLGVGLYGAIYLLPLFLFSVSGYNTIQIGTTMMVAGIAQFLSAPVAGKLTSTGMDPRIVLMIGLLLFGSGCCLNSFLTAESAWQDFLWPQIVRGFALMFCFIPVNDIALATIERSQIQNASGLYNLTRNLGGAIGLAVINNLLTNKTKANLQYLSENITSSNVLATEQITNLTYYFGDKIALANNGAMEIIHKQIQLNAFIIAINDLFMLIGLCFFASSMLLPFTTKAKAVGSNEHAH